MSQSSRAFTVRHAAPAAALLVLLALANAAPAYATSLRFFGHGGSAGDGFYFPDRVSINIEPQSPADVGATDFTVEFWVRGLLADNPRPAQACGTGMAWRNGNIVVDRDRFNQGRKWGVSLMGGKVAFGVSNGLTEYTLCGSRAVLDGNWHHVAVQRRFIDGRMWIWVDGQMDIQGPFPDSGPSQDVSYPDTELPGEFCSPDGGAGTLTCLSDYTLVLGAEKHGFSGFSFSGWMDEVRLSTTLRYAAPFVRPTTPFTNDPSTAALYHFDEGAGENAADEATALGPVPGYLQVGGAAPEGPLWAQDSPFDGSIDAPSHIATPDGLRLLPASPSPFRDVTVVAFELPRPQRARVMVLDLRGRLVRRLMQDDAQLSAGRHEARWDGRDAAGKTVAPGTYLVRVETDLSAQTTTLVRAR